MSRLLRLPILLALTWALFATTVVPISGEASAVLTPVRTTSLAADDRFWTKNDTRYYSPWYAGRHRIMIPFGCTRAPYYAPDPRCVRQRGFHHGIDIAMRCGSKLFSNVRGRIAPRWGAGALGLAYGAEAFRIRSNNRDYVIGHVRRAYFKPGQRIRPGDLIGRVGQRGAPDGCHLHFEVRPKGGSYTQAVDPRKAIKLSRRPA